MILQLHLQDAVQQVAGRGHHSELFLRLWEYRTQIDEERNFQAWVFTVARNLVYREGRRMLLNSAFIDVVQQEGPPEGGGKTRPTTW